MIPHKIYRMGAMLGLQNRDIRDLVAKASISDGPNKLETSSPTDTYKDDGIWYGTISINDFK